MKKIVDMDKWFDDYYRAIYGVQNRVKFDPCYVHTIKEINLWLDSQPDAEEKRGKWVLHKDGSGTCTRCNTTQMHVWDMEGFQNYCGHCGASMYLGEEE